MAVSVPRVPQASGGLDRDPHCLWGEVRQGQVRHVEPRRAVLEYVDVMFRPEDAFLDRLRGLRPRDHPLDGLDVRRLLFFFLLMRGPPESPLFPSPPLSR